MADDPAQARELPRRVRRVRLRRSPRFTEDDVERLLGDAGIVRHRGKIESTIANAARVVELVAGQGSLAASVWSFATRARPARKDLKRRGLRFVGPTTVYAFMQAMGLVNDHRRMLGARDGGRGRAAFTPPAA